MIDAIGMNDIFKSTFLANFGAVTIADMTLTLALSLGMGLFIFLIYKKSYRGVMYESGFGKSLVAMTMITATLILAVSSNVVMSLGMVGALSIVRFRTAIKDPMEIVFLFWSIETGIVLASGMIPLGVVGNILLGFILLALGLDQDYSCPYLLVIQCDASDEEDVMNYFQDVLLLDINRKRQRILRSRTVKRGEYPGPDTVELVVELRRGDYQDTSIREICSDLLSPNCGAKNVAAVSYDGNYMG